MLQGYTVFSPISHSHPIAKEVELPETWDFWEKVDIPFLLWSDKLIVIMAPGWQESEGVQHEIHTALENGLELEYIGLDDIGERYFKEPPAPI